MTLPILQKTWQGGSSPGGTQFVNQTITVSDPRDTLLAIKDALIGFNSNPWTVIGSCNASGFGMDAVDRWSGIGDLTYRAAALSNISWIVLQQSNINSKFQVCFYLGDSLASDPQRENISIAISPSAGFGTVNGGTDGGLNTPPTATDGTSIDGTNWHGAENGGDSNKRLSCIQSTDGECTRIIIAHIGTSTPVSCMGFEVPRLPDASWTDAVIYYLMRETVASGDNCFNREGIANTSVIRAVLPDYAAVLAQRDLQLLGPQVNGGTKPEVFYNQDNGNAYLFAGPLYYQEKDAIPVWGTMFDWYWVSRDTGGAHAADLDTMPLAGDRTFVCVGDIVIGWLDDNLTDLQY